jgi:hypothetical protein
MSVAHGASRGNKHRINSKAPEGRHNLCRPSGALNQMLEWIPMTYVMGY